MIGSLIQIDWGFELKYIKDDKIALQKGEVEIYDGYKNKILKVIYEPKSRGMSSGNYFLLNKDGSDVDPKVWEKHILEAIIGGYSMFYLKHHIVQKF